MISLWSFIYCCFIKRLNSSTLTEFVDIELVNLPVPLESEIIIY
jgi:hypothetical protein